MAADRCPSRAENEKGDLRGGGPHPAPSYSPLPFVEPHQPSSFRVCSILHWPGSTCSGIAMGPVGYTHRPCFLPHTCSRHGHLCYIQPSPAPPLPRFEKSWQGRHWTSWLPTPPTHPSMQGLSLAVPAKFLPTAHLTERGPRVFPPWHIKEPVCSRMWLFHSVWEPSNHPILLPRNNQSDRAGVLRSALLG